MTNAELAKYFASLPPDAEASIEILNADNGLIEDGSIVAATEHMLEQIEDECFLTPGKLMGEQDEDEEERQVAENRKAMVGTPVIFRKW